MSGQKLVIVESPAKARTIGKMLGDEFLIRASMGHVRDLPEHSFGVDIENNFAPQYEVTSSRSKTLGELKTLAKGVDEIYLAPDPDREGEAIAWHLKEVLSKGSKAEFHRVSFHEITKSAIAKAFQAPGELDMDRVDAQQARRVLDRLVGYMISPLLWSRIERGISAGRVQSVALRLVCEREREILKFVPKEYWNFIALFEAGAPGSGKTFEAKLNKIDGAKFEIGNGVDAEAALKGVRSAKAYKVSNVETAPRRRFAPPPFITSTMQQAASSALGFSANSTMRVAQQLYEGVDVGTGGPIGLITYMRTDSVAVAVEAQNACRSFVASEYGKDYVPAKPNFFKSKESSQGAHEAIRPTDVSMTPDKLKSFLDAQQLKLYTLVWRRFMASQMAPAEQMKTAVDVDANGTDGHAYSFRAVATVTTFPGFLRAYDIVEEGASSGGEDDEAKPSEILGELKKGDASSLKDSKSEQKFTEPPPRFSEATLIKELEANGIGRPSTYASIVNTIQERKYVAKDKGKLIPSELGFKVNDYLVSTLPELFQVGFTADMETKLDKVEEGQVQWTGMLKEFYDKFSKWIGDAKDVGAPEKEKADALIALIGKVATWEAPEKGARKTYDDKKFFKSIVTKYEKTPKISGRQWEALLGLAVKYAEQLPGLDAFAAKHGFSEDLAAAKVKSEERAEKVKEIKARREEAAASGPPKHELDAAFAAMEAVKWSAPEKRRGRVYDDKKFFDSLKKQHDSGRALSDKQLSALGKMSSRYKDQIANFDEVCKVLAAGPVAEQSEEAKAAASAASEEVDKILEALSKVEKWGEPVKKGRKTYDDKEFFDSLSKQRAAGKTLSDRQVGALKKMAGRYGK